MIKFSFSFVNPWARDFPHTDYFYRHKNFTKNKSGELQISKSSSYNLFRIFLNTSFRGEDHAGPELSMEFGKYHFMVNLYDHRHWDYESGSWETPRK